jgi:hypothetical protein
MRPVIVDVSESLAWVEAKRTQPDRAGVGAVTAIIRTKNVEAMEMFITPVEENLQHEVKLGQGGVAAHHESAPDERTDASQDDAQLVDVGVGSLRFHEQSV